MQFLVLFAILGVSLADSDAGHIYGGYGGYAGYGGYTGYGGYGGYGHGYGHGYPLRTGVLPATVGGGLVHHYNGAVVPADEPAVVAARADHFAAKAHTYGAYGHHGIYKREADAGHLYGGAYGYAGHHGSYYGGYHGPLSAALPATVGGGLVSHPNGAVVPSNEPAVAAARADHLLAHGAAYRNAYAHGYGTYGAYGHHGIYKREADAGHLYGGAYGYGGHGYAGHHGSYYGGYHGPLSAALPATVGGGLVSHPNGAVVPANEPAVAAARADHLLAHGAAFKNAYGHGYGAYLW